MLLPLLQNTTQSIIPLLFLYIHHNYFYYYYCFFYSKLRYEEKYKKLKWKMFERIDRIYYPTKAVEKLNFSPKFNFVSHLEEVINKK